jgi:hypothetical protein
VPDRDAVWPAVRALAPATVIVDVEPLVAAWGTDGTALASGLREQVAAGQGGGALVFVTNSGRQAPPEVAVPYVAHGRKPFTSRRRLGALNSPVAVVGDQVLTDGLLAWRLRGTFVQLALPRQAPAVYRLQALAGRLVAGLFFRAARA